ncbi:MAG: hypothetical protein WBL20_04600 [Sphingobium sp.]|uniref:hypothetical protein n=1 Tax=Sphingobium sp. TaxID=1912891 RepID=UPI003BB2156C
MSAEGRTMRWVVLGWAMTLAACGEAEQPAASANATAPETGAAAQVAGLDEATRNTVFEKAIRASGAPCPVVSGSERATLAHGVKGWKAQCDNGTAHLIEILPDGTAKVTSRRD